MRRIIVKQKKEYSLLTTYLLDTFPNLKKSAVFKALRNKDIRVNDVKMTKDMKVVNGDAIAIYLHDTVLFNLPQQLEIIYEDTNLLAVYKPQGILSNTEENLEEHDTFASIGGREPTLETLVQLHYPTAILCHRLDRNTAGIILFAMNTISYEELLCAFKHSLIKKEYIAYVQGATFERNHDVLNNYLTKDASTGYATVYEHMVPKSQPIVTEYTVLKKNTLLDYALLSVVIPTGKTHQIRAQMKQLQHPIIGDSKYGRNDINRKLKVYQQLLFAYRYTFNFRKDSFLAYLNTITLQLREDQYMKKLGEFNEEKR